MGVEQKIPAGGVDRQPGVIVGSPGAYRVNVWGHEIPCRWADPISVKAGDNVLVDLTSGPYGQSGAFVVSKITSGPRPDHGTITGIPASSPTMTVEADGVSYDAAFAGDAANYSVGDRVILSWNSSVPTIIDQVTETPPKTVAAWDQQAPIQAPPAPPDTGVGKFRAVDSGTIWLPGGWGSWAGGGQTVYQGTWGGYTVYGAWFYGTSPANLDGRIIERIEFRIPRRLAVGNYNNSAAMHLFAHTSARKPNGDVNRVKGPFDVSRRPGAKAEWVDLPTDFAATVIAGGGIAVAGGPYMAFEGRHPQDDPESGYLRIHWKK